MHMNQRGGLLAFGLFLFIIGAMTFFFLNMIGNPLEIPIAFGFALPTMVLGAGLFVMGILFGGEMFLISLGIAISLHWAWFSGILH